MAIDWLKFKKLIGNGHRKYVSRENKLYHFVSYNEENETVTVMSARAKRTLRVIGWGEFVGDFTFVKQTEEKPLFYTRTGDSHV